MSSSQSVSNIFALLVILCALLATCNAFYVNPDYYYGDQLPLMKKSGQLRALAGSRNCFFSPVNCIITHDINSYRKMAKGSSYA